MDVRAELINKVVLPGDEIGRLIIAPSSSSSSSAEASSSSKPPSKVRLGVGLMQENDKVVATKAGVFRYVPPSKYYIESSSKRYVPSVEDLIIGTVTDKNVEFYRLDIGGNAKAVLPAIAFDGASRRNKPNLNIGSAVYTRVAVASRDMDPELTCCGTGKDWVSGESLFGELNGGYIFETTLSLARSLLSPDCPVLVAIGRKIPFEIAVGMNGRVWINSTSTANLVLISNAILNAEHMSKLEVEAMVAKLLKAVAA